MKTPVNVRTDIADFARIMELVLSRHDKNKSGYDRGELPSMYLKLGEEVGEVGSLILSRLTSWGGGDRLYEYSSQERIDMLEKLQQECADVANIAMMMSKRAEVFLGDARVSLKNENKRRELK